MMVGSPLILMGYLVIGVFTAIRFSGRDAEDAPSWLALVALYAAAVAFAAFAMFMANRQDSAKFLGLSRLTWPVAAIISFLVGLVGYLFL